MSRRDPNRPAPRLIWVNPRHAEIEAAIRVGYRIRGALHGSGLTIGLAALGAIAVTGLVHVDDDDFADWIEGVRNARAEARGRP